MEKYCLLIAKKNLKYSDYFFNELRVLLKNFKKLYKYDTYLCDQSNIILRTCLNGECVKYFLIENKKHFKKNLYVINNRLLSTLGVAQFCDNFLFIGYNDKQKEKIKAIMKEDFSNTNCIFLDEKVK